MSAGITFDPSSRFSVSVDYYDIKISDRIVFSENFIGAAIQARLAAIGLTGVTGARYFTNAIDTHTRGVDVVANYGLDLGGTGVLRFTGGYNHNKNEVTKVIPTPPELTGFDEQLFGKAERGRIEEAQPRDNLLLSANYTAACSAPWCAHSGSVKSRTDRSGSPRTSHPIRHFRRSG